MKHPIGYLSVCTRHFGMRSVAELVSIHFPPNQDLKPLSHSTRKYIFLNATLKIFVHYLQSHALNWTIVSYTQAGTYRGSGIRVCSPSWNMKILTIQPTIWLFSHNSLQCIFFFFYFPFPLIRILLYQPGNNINRQYVRYTFRCSNGGKNGFSQRRIQFLEQAQDFQRI